MANHFLYHIDNSSNKIQSYKNNSVGRAFLVSPQNISKKSQDYEKRLLRHFTQMAVLQSDAFSCTTQKLIQATRKARLPSPRADFLLLRLKKNRQYDKRKPYRLVLREAETGIEQQSVEVSINRTFTEDI